MLVLVSTQGYLFTFIAFSLFIVGWSFEDGAYKSWILQFVDNETEGLRNLNINLRYVFSIGLVSGSIIGSIIFDIHEMYPWYLSTILCALSLLIAFFVPSRQKIEINIKNKIEKIKALPKAFLEVLKDHSLLYLALLDASLYLCFGFVSSASYPYINEIIPDNIIARVGIYQLCLSSGSIIGNYLQKKFRTNKTFCISLFYLFPILYIANVLTPIFGLSPVIFLAISFIRSIGSSFYMNTIFTIQDIEIKKHENVKASLYSMLEIVRDGFSAIAIIIASRLGSFPYTNIWKSSAIALFVFLILLLSNNNLRKNIKSW